MKSTKSALMMLSVGMTTLSMSPLARAGELVDGRYSITAVHSGKCVDILASGQSDGVNVQQYTCNSGLAQAFDMVEASPGEYKLMAAVSGKAVDVAEASKLDGANIQQWTDNATSAQRFFIRKVPGTSNDFNIVNKNSGKCVDVVGGFTQDGANVQQWTCNGNLQQRFRFNLKAAGYPVKDGRYSVKALHSGKCLDVPASSLIDGADMQQYTCNRSGAQTFDVKRDTDGFYQLVNVVSGKVLDLTASGMADGIRAQQWTNLHADNQRVSFIGKGNAQYEIRFKHSGKCLDIVGQYNTDGAAAQQWTCNGQSNQKWTLTPVVSSGDGGQSGGGQTGGSPTAQTKAKILSFLDGISGKQTVVGVENKNTGSPTQDTDLITSWTGKVSSFWGADFGFGGAVNTRTTMVGEAKKQFAKGALVGLMYHACAPTQNEFCSWDDIGGSRPVKLTNDQFKQLLTPGTALNNAWIGRLNTLAGYLQDLKNSGVVVLFRPFHEMNQCAFWWSCHTGTYSSAALYKMTHDYLSRTKGLDNLIWVWNVQDFTSLSRDADTYNPGADYFDIAALDVYNTGLTSGNYATMQRVSGGKPIAIAEIGKMPTSDELRQQPKWAYAMVWPDFLYDRGDSHWAYIVNRPNLPKLYQASNVLTLDEMPGWR